MMLKHPNHIVGTGGMGGSGIANQLWPGQWATQSPYANIHDVYASPPKIRRKTKQEIALEKAKKEATSISIPYKVGDVDMSYFFYHIHADVILELFGNMRPVHAGRPLPWAWSMLNAVPSPARARSKTGSAHYHQGNLAGLYMRLPPVVGKRRTSFRLTGTGLLLLDHLAEKNKGFRPFVEAFVSKKARREINSDTVSLSFKLIPPKIMKVLFDNEVANRKSELEKLEAHRQKTLMELQRQQAMKQYQTATTWLDHATTTFPDSNITWNGTVTTASPAVGIGNNTVTNSSYYDSTTWTGESSTVSNSIFNTIGKLFGSNT